MLRFKYALRQCNQNEKSTHADLYAKSLMNKDMTSFWDSIRKSSNTRIPLASMIDNGTGEENIAHMWQDHYNSLLNSVKGNSSKQVIHDKLGTIPSEWKSIPFTNSDLNSALKSLKRGKACGVDGLAAEHFLYAHSITHVLLIVMLVVILLINESIILCMQMIFVSWHLLALQCRICLMPATIMELQMIFYLIL